MCVTESRNPRDKPLLTQIIKWRPLHGHKGKGCRFRKGKALSQAKQDAENAQQKMHSIYYIHHYLLSLIASEFIQ